MQLEHLQLFDCRGSPIAKKCRFARYAFKCTYYQVLWVPGYQNTKGHHLNVRVTEWYEVQCVLYQEEYRDVKSLCGLSLLVQFLYKDFFLSVINVASLLRSVGTRKIRSCLTAICRQFCGNVYSIDFTTCWIRNNRSVSIGKSVCA